MFVSAGRSDYGIMRNIILKVSKSRNFKTSLIITGSHLSKKFGKTIREVKQDNIKNIYKIYSSINDYKTDNTNFFISKIIKDSDIILRKEKVPANLDNNVMKKIFSACNEKFSSK